MVYDDHRCIPNLSTFFLSYTPALEKNPYLFTYLLMTVVSFMFCHMLISIICLWFAFLYQSTAGNREAYFRLMSAVEVTNCLMLINFASNVVLYCAINAHFRRVVQHIFCGEGSLLFRWRTRRRHDRAESATYAAIALGKPTQNSIDAIDL